MEEESYSNSHACCSDESLVSSGNINTEGRLEFGIESGVAMASQDFKLLDDLMNDEESDNEQHHSFNCENDEDEAAGDETLVDDDEDDDEGLEGGQNEESSKPAKLIISTNDDLSNFMSRHDTDDHSTGDDDMSESATSSTDDPLKRERSSSFFSRMRKSFHLPSRKRKSSSSIILTRKGSAGYIGINESPLALERATESSEVFKLKSSGVEVPEAVEELPKFLSQINFKSPVSITPPHSLTQSNNSSIANHINEGDSTDDNASNNPKDFDLDATESKLGSKFQAENMAKIGEDGKISINAGDIYCRIVEKSDFLNRKVIRAFGEKVKEPWRMSWMELRNEFFVLYKEDKQGKTGGNKQVIRRSQEPGIVRLFKTITSIGKKDDKDASRNPIVEKKSDLIDNSTSYMPYTRRGIAYVIHLGGCSIEPAYKITGRKYTFRIITSRKFEIVCGCNSLNMMSDWIDVIRRRIEEIGVVRLPSGDLLEESKRLHQALHHKCRISRKEVSPKASKQPSNAKKGGIFSGRFWKGGKSKGTPENDNVFGMSLAEYAKNQAALKSNLLFPAFIKEGFEKVEELGLKSEGVYRICGNALVIRILRDKIIQDQGKGSYFNDVSLFDNDVNVICGVLKAFFREMKEPLLTFSAYDDLIRASDIGDERARIDAIKSIIQEKLPVANKSLLQVLLNHLKSIHLHNLDNKMTASNLALLFGPSIMRPESDDVQYFVHITKISTVVTLMILNCDALFNNDGDHTDDLESVKA